MKFFLVDDDSDILSLLSRVLEGAGHAVETCHSSIEALKRIPAARPDCVVTDIMMPDMDGFELTRELRRRPDLADMKIIVLSAKTYEFDRRRAKQLGADGYLSKPFQLETLLDSIMETVSSRVVVAFWGVHGTLPTPGAAYLRYGGNTPCVSVEVGGEPLYVFDCGSGIKRLSDFLMATAAGQRFGVRRVGGCVLRIETPKFFRDHAQPGLAVLGVETEAGGRAAGGAGVGRWPGSRAQAGPRQYRDA